LRFYFFKDCFFFISALLLTLGKRDRSVARANADVRLLTLSSVEGLNASAISIEFAISVWCPSASEVGGGSFPSASFAEIWTLSGVVWSIFGIFVHGDACLNTTSRLTSNLQTIVLKVLLHWYIRPFQRWVGWSGWNYSIAWCHWISSFLFLTSHSVWRWQISSSSLVLKGWGKHVSISVPCWTRLALVIQICFSVRQILWVFVTSLLFIRKYFHTLVGPLCRLDLSWSVNILGWVRPWVIVKVVIFDCIWHVRSISGDAWVLAISVLSFTSVSLISNSLLWAFSP